MENILNVLVINVITNSSYKLSEYIKLTYIRGLYIKINKLSHTPNNLTNEYTKYK